MDWICRGLVYRCNKTFDVENLSRFPCSTLDESCSRRPVWKFKWKNQLVHLYICGIFDIYGIYIYGIYMEFILANLFIFLPHCSIVDINSNCLKDLLQKYNLEIKNVINFKDLLPKKPDDSACFGWAERGRRCPVLTWENIW